MNHQVHHVRVSPFPVIIPKGVIIDEMCGCGARRSEHEDTFGYGHGTCKRTECPKFSWASFVVSENVQTELVATLREVLKRGCHCRNTDDPNWHGDHCLIPQIKAVLAKAEGQAQF